MQPLTIPLTRVFALLILSVALPVAGRCQEKPTESALVVCPAQFRNALAPWVGYRRDQGVDVRVIDSAANAEALTESIRDNVRAADRSLLLVGDAPVIGSVVDASRQIPMHYVATTVSAQFGSTPTMATDFPYGDIDGDGICDLAVGRLPVQTATQLDDFIRRIKAYESSRDFSFWRQRVQLVGGVGGFGILADSAIESVTRLMVTASLPQSVRTSIAYGSPGHLFYPRTRFSDAVSERYSDGCRFWVYAGHGMVDRLDQVPRGPTGVPVLDSDSVAKLQCDPANAPIAVLLCCFTGAIDAGVDSFSERMLRHPCGPIAVIAGNRVTMPYGNATLTLGLIDAIYGRPNSSATDGDSRDPATRIGEAWLHAVRKLQSEQETEATQLQTMLDAVATLVSPAGTKLADERTEHASLYSLLGDPLLRLHPPAPVQVVTETGFSHGDPVVVTVTSPIDGECVVMLDHPLGEQKRSPNGTPHQDPNELTLARAVADIKAGQPQQFSIPIDDPRRGALQIRVHVAGDQTWAAGGGQTILRPPSQ